MRTVWKFTLLVTDEQTVEMPVGAELLSVGVQPPLDTQAIQLWALVEPGWRKVPRRLTIHGTGNPFPDAPGKFVGSVIAANGALVWHVFDHGEAAPGKAAA